MFILPMLVLLGGFLFYPLVYGIALSAHDSQGFEPTQFVGLDNYVRAILGDAVFHRSLLNTIVFTVAAVVLQTGIGLFLAVLVAGVRRGRTFFLVAFFAPFVLASVAVGAVWKFLYAPFFGIAATMGSALGFDTSTIAPLADADTALWAVMAAFLWRFAGFSMVVYVAAIQALSRDYYDLAVLEGATWFQRLRHITWPLLWPQTFTLVLLSTIGTLRIFDMVWIMTAGGPAHATETVATHVYTTAFRFLDIGYAQAMAMILLVVILVLTVVEYRILNPRAEMVSS
jgi:raffinose/stachyose/melibiose transport system permease protein